MTGVCFFWSHLKQSRTSLATAAGRRVYVAESVSADLAFFLDDAGVDEQIQFDSTQHFKTVRRFSALGDDRASVRAALLAA